MSSGTVSDIFIGSRATVPLSSVSSASLVAGRGIVGDRYYEGNGTFSEKLRGKPDVELTLIEREEIARLNASLATRFKSGDFRRNVVTENIRLNDLVGRLFRVGAVELEGIRLCEPCAHLASLLDARVASEMAHLAGLRARIVTSGAIDVGDKVTAP